MRRVSLGEVVAVILDRWLRQRNLTAVKLHEMSGIAESTISQLRNNKRTLRANHVDDLAEAMGMSLDEFALLVARTAMELALEPATQLKEGEGRGMVKQSRRAAIDADVSLRREVEQRGSKRLPPPTEEPPYRRPPGRRRRHVP